MKQAGKLKSNYTVIIGSDELQKGIAIVKDMEKGSQETVSLGSVADFIIHSLFFAIKNS